MSHRSAKIRGQEGALELGPLEASPPTPAGSDCSGPRFSYPRTDIPQFLWAPLLDHSHRKHIFSWYPTEISLLPACAHSPLYNLWEESGSNPVSALAFAFTELGDVPDGPLLGLKFLFILPVQLMFLIMWEKFKLLTYPNTNSQLMKTGNVFKQLRDTCQ